MFHNDVPQLQEKGFVSLFVMEQDNCKSVFIIIYLFWLLFFLYYYFFIIIFIILVLLMYLIIKLILQKTFEYDEFLKIRK